MNEPKYGQRADVATNTIEYSEAFLGSIARTRIMRMLGEHFFGFVFFVLTFLCIVGTELELWQRLAGGFFSFCIGAMFMATGNSDE